MRINLIAAVIWSIISLVAVYISGSAYYKLSNIFIPILPPIIFLTSVLLYPRAKISPAFGPFYLKTRFKIIFVIMCMITIFLISFAMIFWGLNPLSGSKNRVNFYQSLMPFLGVYFVWFYWLFSGFIFGGLIALLISFMSGSKLSLFPVLVSLLATLGFSLVTGGRTQIFILLISFSVMFVLWGNLRLKFSRKFFKLFFSLTLFVGALFTFVTVNRMEIGVINSFGELTLVKYFVGPIFALDQLSTSGAVSEMSKELARPTYFVKGLDTFIVSGFLRGVLGMDIPSALATSSYTLHHGVFIQSTITMNAHYTGGLGFYTDFGIFGYITFFALLSFANIYCAKGQLGLLGVTLQFYIGLATLLSMRENIFDSPAYLFAIFFTYVGLRQTKGERIVLH